MSIVLNEAEGVVQTTDGTRIFYTTVVSIQPAVARFPHDTHAAFAELLDDLVMRDRLVHHLRPLTNDAANERREFTGGE